MRGTEHSESINQFNQSHVLGSPPVAELAGPVAMKVPLGL
jgi:hypothetical protein